MKEKTSESVINDSNKLDSLSEKLNKLFSDYNVDNYIIIAQSKDSNEDKTFTITKSNDLMMNTKILKIAHQNFLSAVMKNIGESN